MSAPAGPSGAGSGPTLRSPHSHTPGGLFVETSGGLCFARCQGCEPIRLPPARVPGCKRRAIGGGLCLRQFE
eukprot:13351537-Alexandrium_andersonii.AAC.1